MLVGNVSCYIKEKISYEDTTSWINNMATKVRKSKKKCRSDYNFGHGRGNKCVV
jgi:hypothetical protein